MRFPFPLILCLFIVKSSRAQPKPDLRCTSLNAVVTDSSVEAGVKKYRVSVQFTVRNEGGAAVSSDQVSIKGYITHEGLVGKKQDLTNTAVYRPAGGSMLSTIPHKGEMLVPGASKSGSWIVRVPLTKTPRPVYFVQVVATVEESDKQNNTAFKTILL